MCEIEEETTMKKYGVNELRQMFLDFMESKGHLVMKSFSLVPQGDKSLLLINAGNGSFKSHILPEQRFRPEQEWQPARNASVPAISKTWEKLPATALSLRCSENFSFGDYFKHEAIAWSWEFLTKVWDLIRSAVSVRISGG